MTNGSGLTMHWDGAAFVYVSTPRGDPNPSP
jgi:hypothetical protein